MEVCVSLCMRGICVCVCESSEGKETERIPHSILWLRPYDKDKCMNANGVLRVIPVHPSIF